MLPLQILMTTPTNRRPEILLHKPLHATLSSIEHTFTRVSTNPNALSSPQSAPPRIPSPNTRVRPYQPRPGSA